MKKIFFLQKFAVKDKCQFYEINATFILIVQKLFNST